MAFELALPAHQRHRAHIGSPIRQSVRVVDHGRVPLLLAAVSLHLDHRAIAVEGGPGAQREGQRGENDLGRAGAVGGRNVLQDRLGDRFGGDDGSPLQVAGGQLPGKLGEFGQDTPLGRAGQPAELAALYVTLADPGVSFTTGSVFGANGGTGAV